MATIQEILNQATQQSSANYQPLIEANPAAANMLASGAVNAGNIGQNYLQQGIGSIQQGGAAATATRDPFIQGSQGALSQALDLTGISGKSPDQVLAQMQQSPAYQFNLNEQLGAIERGAGARGKLYSGQTAMALQDRASQVASNEYQNQINNALSLLGQTSPFASQQASQQYTQGGDVATVQSQIGDALANAELARTNALSSGIMGEAEARVAQSTQGGAALPALDQEQYVGGSTSPWDSALGGGAGGAGGGGSNLLAGLGDQGAGGSSAAGGAIQGAPSVAGDGTVPLTGGDSTASASGTVTTEDGQNLQYNPTTQQFEPVAATGGSTLGAAVGSGTGTGTFAPEQVGYTAGQAITGGLGEGAAPTNVDIAAGFDSAGLPRLSQVASLSPELASQMQGFTPEQQTNFNDLLGGAESALDTASPEEQDRFYWVLNKLFEDAPTYREPHHIQNNINSALRQSGLRA